MASDSPFAQAKHITVIKLDGIGDFILAIPFFLELRLWSPSSRISLMVRPDLAPFLDDCPYVDEVIPITPWNRRKESRGQFENRCRPLLPATCDLAIIPRWDMDFYGATVLASLTGADLRIGVSEKVYDKKAIRNKGYDQELTHPVMVPDHIIHETDRSLYLLEHFGRTVTHRKPEFWPTEQARVKHIPLFTNRPLVGFGIGAAVTHKQWPVEAFGELAHLLSHKLSFTILLLGSEADRDRAAHIIHWLESEAQEQSPQIIDVTGKTSLIQLRHLINRCTLVVSNDTSVMHFAGALERPIYGIGAHSARASLLDAGVPERFAPKTERLRYFSPQQPLPPCTAHCQSAEAHCIKTIKPAQIFEAIVQDHKNLP